MNYGLVFAALLCLATTGTLPAGELPRTPRDTLVVASDLNPIRNLDPGGTYIRNALMQLNNVYDRLIVAPSDDCGRAGVAESWQVSEDGMEYTFRIREGLRFQSGNPVRAEDVVFSLRRVAQMRRAMTRFTASIGLTSGNVDSRLAAIGPLEVRLRLAEPLSPDFVLNVLSSAVSFVVDEKTVMRHARNGDYGHEWLSRHSAGSGPFHVKDWEPRQWLILESNGFHGGRSGRVHRIIIRDVQEPTLRRLLLSKADADIATDLSSDQIAALRTDPQVTLSSEPAARLIYMVMNQANPALRVPAVRRAINLLIDRRKIASTMLNGTYRPHQGFWPGDLWASLEEPVYRFDPDEARALLAAAGYPSGLRIEIDVSTLYPYPQIAQSMQAMLADGGIEAELIFSDDAQNLTKMTNRRYSGLIMRSFNVLYPDPHDAVEWMVMNRENGDGTALRNAAWRAGFVDEELMALALEALHEKDRERRRELYLELQRALQVDGTVSVLFQQLHTVALRNNISGYCQGPLLDQLNYSSVVKH